MRLFHESLFVKIVSRVECQSGVQLVMIKINLMQNRTWDLPQMFRHENHKHLNN